MTSTSEARGRGRLAAGAFALLGAAVAWANQPFLVADGTVVEQGKPVKLRLAEGVPSHGVVGATPVPQSAVVHLPDGTFVDLGDQLPQDAEPSDWQVTYTPKQPGDHVVFVQAHPRQLDGDYVTDFVKLVLNVGGLERGWDRPLRQRFELVPLTRPYGIPAGALFRAQLLTGGQPGAGLVRIERWSPSGPAAGAPPLHLARSERTGPMGEVAVILDKPGFWSLSARGVGRTVQVAGQRTQEVLRTTLWVHVDPS